MSALGHLPDWDSCMHNPFVRLVPKADIQPDQADRDEVTHRGSNTLVLPVSRKLVVFLSPCILPSPLA